jgi:hypothetical protein
MRPLGWLCTLMVLLLGAYRAEAHGLGAECKLHGKRVELEAYFDDDTPARGATVRVEDVGRKAVAEGRTDAKGLWSFPRPQPGRYVVHVDAGAGHRTEVKVTIPEGEERPGDEPAESGTAPPEPAAPVTVSEGPGREEFTRFPWLKLGIGVAVIGGVAAAFLISRRLGRTTG